MSQEAIARIRDEEEKLDTTTPSAVKSPVEVGSQYPGRGTLEDPFIVDWDLGDPENPFNWSILRKWIITMQARANPTTHSLTLNKSITACYRDLDSLVLQQFILWRPGIHVKRTSLVSRGSCSWCVVVCPRIRFRVNATSRVIGNHRR